MIVADGVGYLFGPILNISRNQCLATITAQRDGKCKVFAFGEVIIFLATIPIVFAFERILLTRQTNLGDNLTGSTRVIIMRCYNGLVACGAISGIVVVYLNTSRIRRDGKCISIIVRVI